MNLFFFHAVYKCFAPTPNKTAGRERNVKKRTILLPDTCCAFFTRKPCELKGVL